MTELVEMVGGAVAIITVITMGAELIGDWLFRRKKGPS